LIVPVSSVNVTVWLIVPVSSVNVTI
jgi:hypothetical protein